MSSAMVKLTKLWTVLKGGLANAPIIDGITFIGTFEPDGTRIAGYVVDVTQAHREVSEGMIRRPRLIVA
jgi:hypothetical protein